MHRSENHEVVECMDCGAVIAAERDRAYAISDDEYLCFECAVRRGGSYDEQHDRWTRAPDVSDEPDERRPHP